MKIRISGNSVRFRLTKTDILRLKEIGVITEVTRFGSDIFSYSVWRDKNVTALTATFAQGCITLSTPATFLENWYDNDVVGLEGHMPLSDNESLYLLLEKDFKCLDRTAEDESDHFENPKTIC